MAEKVKCCRICGNSKLIEIIDLGNQMLTGVFPRTRQQKITQGPLRLVKCDGRSEDVCGLLQLAHSYELGEMYGENYGYRSGLNKSMVDHLRGKVRKILSIANLKDGDLVIDIGSNDGTTLRAYPDKGITLVGIDPTGVKFRSYYPEHIHLIPEFFSRNAVRKHFGERRARIITSFSMFYDLEEPMSFMREIADVLDDEGLWVFEQSYMPTMLKTNSYDTICQEHLEYYALKQIKWMTDRVGLKIVDVEFNDVNGGSFSVTVGKRDSSYPEASNLGFLLDCEVALKLDLLEPYQQFARRAQQTRDDLLRFVKEVKAEGKRIFGLGASTKGNVILQYCGITPADLEAIGEVNSDKFGSYTPGTNIPIISEDELLAKKPDYLLVLPWHFRKFFEANPKFHGLTLVFPLPKLELVTIPSQAAPGVIS